jgi:hypothetical protein
MEICFDAIYGNENGLKGQTDGDFEKFNVSEMLKNEYYMSHKSYLM